MKYRPEIDGLRAVAVIPVICFHAGIGLFSGGYVGVDVFFVISGYLITGILQSDLMRGRFSILRFYERRARRILPALFCVMLACIPPALALMLPPQLKDFSQSLVATTLFGSNVLSWMEAGYFAAASELKPLLHTWSLAVEEQYYVIFPLLLALLWRAGVRWVLPSIAVLAALSFLACLWSVTYAPNANFYLVHTRAWELLAGSMCALINRNREMRPRPALAALGLAMILFAVFAFDGQTPFPSAYALLPVGGTALVVLYGGKDGWAHRLLTARPLIWVGLVSYSAYLWHQPLFAFARLAAEEAVPPFGVMLALVVATFVLAWLTWRYVEQPFRRNPTPFLSRRSALFASCAAAGLGFVTLGAAGHLTNGARPVWMQVHAEIAESFLRIERAESQATMRGDGVCRFNVSHITAAVEQRLSNCHERFGPAVVVLGDSHAADLFGVVAGRSDSQPFTVGLTSGGCRPHDPNPACQYDDFLRLVRTHGDWFDLVIYEQAGFYLLTRDGVTPGDREIFESVPRTGRVPDLKVNGAYVDSVVHYLSMVARYVPVVWLGPRVEPHIPLRQTLRASCDESFMLRDNQAEAFARLDQYLRSRLTGTGLGFLSQNDAFSFQFPRDFWDCRQLYWSDGDHLSEAGERLFGGRADIAGLARSAAATARRAQ